MSFVTKGREKVFFDAGGPYKSNSIVRHSEKVIWAGDCRKANGAVCQGQARKNV